MRLCLDCGAETPNSRCSSCEHQRRNARANRDHYKGDWPAIAAAAKQRAGHKCELCGSTYKLGVHHRLPRNLEAGVLVLCAHCHARHHAHP